MSGAIALLVKDLRLELRRRETLIAVFFFAWIVLVLFYMAFPPGALTEAQKAALRPGMLWISLAFAGIVSVMRAFDRERASRTLDGLLLAPVPPALIYAAKLLSTLTWLLLTELLLFPLFVAMFNVPVTARTPLIALPMVLGSIGYVSVGTLFSAVTARLQAREVLLPILIFPVTFPVLITAVESTAAVLGVWKPQVFWSMCAFLAGTDVFFVLAAGLLFPFAVRE